MTFIYAFFEKIVMALLVKGTVALPGQIWKFLRGYVSHVDAYKKTLMTSISTMPFIYRDLPLDLLGTFVDIELAQDGTSGRYSLRSLQRLQDVRKFILVGEAGIGKSTFFSYIAAVLLQSKGHAVFLLPGEPKLLPLFIPLKAVKATDDFPLVRYLQRSHPLFAGNRGLSRLAKLAGRKRLMMLIDGYDEAPTVGGMQRIHSEIRLLYNHNVEAVRRALRTSSPGIQKFYHNFVGSRIALSSRPEFLTLNPIRVSSDVRNIFARGIWENRQKLVEHIFNRYRVRDNYFLEKLHDELFMQRLSISGRGGLQDLSRNPLYLTIMCFVYVDVIRNERDPLQSWRNGEYELIGICIDLLIKDIDEFKARALSNESRQALMNRRSGFLQGKRDFLEWFAAQSYFDDVRVFNLLTGQ